MKISDAFRLSHAEFIHYKRRSLATVIIVGILFGAILSIHLLLQGLENAFLSTATRLTDDTIYLQITPPTDDCPLIFPDDGTPAYFTCPDYDPTPIITSVEHHHGQFLGPMTDTLLATTAQPFVSLDPTTAPANTVPAVISYNQALHYLGITQPPLTNDKITEVYSRTLGQTFTANNTTYYIAGITPSTSLRSSSNTFNPLDLAFAITTTSGLSPNLIPLTPQPTSTPSPAYLVTFSSLDDAYAYINSEHCNYNESSACRSYSIDELYTNRLALHQLFQIDRFILSFPTYILIYLAVLIVFLTFLKITYQSSPTIAFYRAFGANFVDLGLIFLAYFLEICLFAILFALIIGLIISGGFSLANATYLPDLLSASYGVPITGFYLLIGWNGTASLIFCTILLALPFALIFSIPRLANPNFTSLKNLQH